MVLKLTEAPPNRINHLVGDLLTHETANYFAMKLGLYRAQTDPFWLK